jgi:hypothetical protein
MILVNVLLLVLFVFSSYMLWNKVTEWMTNDAYAIWSPLYITPFWVRESYFYIYPDGTTSRPPPQLNTPFILFLVMFALNLLFIIKLGRGKETKQSTT